MVAVAKVGILSTLWFCCRVVRLLKVVGADTFATWAAPRLEVAYAQISGERLHRLHQPASPTDDSCRPRIWVPC